jgi:hypothetical protein
VGAAGAVDADQHLLAAGVPAGQLRQGGAEHRDVVAHGVRAGVARQHARQRLPVPSAPWSHKAHSGWKTNPRLNVGAADSFSLCAPTRVASTSITTGRAASAACSGACSPANDHARSRAAARAFAIAASAAGASAANASMHRETVGSEATAPHISGAARS